MDSEYFQKLSSATFLDTRTGLQWTSCALGQKSVADGSFTNDPKHFSWKTLSPLVKKLSTGKGLSGHKDWRIPTLDEMKHIASHQKAFGKFDDAELVFWTTTSDGEDNAWAIRAVDGQAVSLPKNEPAAVRLVRLATSPQTDFDQPKISERSNLATDFSKNALKSINEQSRKAIKAANLDERKKQARESISLYKLFWTRVLRSDFSVVKASQEEAETLSHQEAAVTNPISQDYASWRRSLLMISLLGIAGSLLFNFVDVAIQLLDGGSHFVVKLQTFLLFGIQLGAAALCLLAALTWANLKRSKSFARLAWLTQFALPFVLFMLPFSLFIEDSYLVASIGISTLVLLAPKIFGLFPGLIRCSLTMKTLLPESNAPGLLGIIIAPLYAMILLVAAIVALQMAELLLGVGLLLIASGLTVVILKSSTLSLPLDQIEASALVKKIKLKQMIFHASGVALITLFAIKHVEMELGWFTSLFIFLFSFISNVTLLTVVMSDLMLAMIYKNHVESLSFIDSDKSKLLTERLNDLSTSGLTDLEAGEAEMATELRQRSELWAKTAEQKKNDMSGYLGRLRQDKKIVDLDS